MVRSVYDQQAIAVATELIAMLHSQGITCHHIFVTAESRRRHQQRRLRMIEIGDHRISKAKLSEVYSDIGFYFPFCQHALLHASAARWTRGRFPAVGERAYALSQCWHFRGSHRKGEGADMDRHRSSAHQIGQEMNLLAQKNSYIRTFLKQKRR